MRSEPERDFGPMHRAESKTDSAARSNQFLSGRSRFLSGSALAAGSSEFPPRVNDSRRLDNYLFNKHQQDCDGRSQREEIQADC
jgi:hypothetical protein